MALQNKLGIIDSAELARTEEKISKAKAVALYENNIVALNMPQSTYDEIIEKYVEMNIAHPFR